MITVEADGRPVALRERLIFSGGEVQPRLLDPPTEAKQITITAHVWSSDDLIELLLVADACASLWRSTSIDLRIPYLPYARQDRACYPGEAFGLRLVGDLLKGLMGHVLFSSIEVWDPHSEVARHVMPVGTVFRRAVGFVRGMPLDWPRTVLVAPDGGAFNRVVECAMALECRMICAKKKRNPDNGQLGPPQIDLVRGDFMPLDPDFLIVDDICDGGRTFVNLARVLRPLTKGKIYLYVTHGIFSNGFTDLHQVIDHIYAANVHPAIGPHNEITDYLTRLT